MNKVCLETVAMIISVTLFVALMSFGLTNEATLEAQAPAPACKSTITGTLVVIPLAR